MRLVIDDRFRILSFDSTQFDFNLSVQIRFFAVVVLKGIDGNEFAGVDVNATVQLIVRIICKREIIQIKTSRVQLNNRKRPLATYNPSFLL